MVNKDIVGKRFGRLVVLDEYRKSTTTRGTDWKCKCDCGNEIFVYRGKLTSGHTSSCGCIVATLGGLSKIKLYSVWANMKDRCYNENNHAYHNYGGKGIRVCEEWLSGFLKFHDWSINNGYKEGLTIERTDSNKNYEPSNCEWITKSENTIRANKSRAGTTYK